MTNDANNLPGSDSPYYPFNMIRYRPYDKMADAEWVAHMTLCQK